MYHRCPDLEGSGRASDFSGKILPLRQQAAVTNEWLTERLETLLPTIMEREEVDMWIVMAREYNEDPVIMTLLPSPMMTARRRTILVFFRRDDGSVERLILARAGLGVYGLYDDAWRRGEEEQQEALGRVVRDRDPKRIAINTSGTFAFADGLTHHEYQYLLDGLGAEYAERTVSKDGVAVGWLEKRTPREITAYTGIMQIAHGIIQEAFSGRVVHPGVSTSEDIVWWFRQRIHDLGLRAWFQPSVRILRAGASEPLAGDTVIEAGDVLHCDVGLHYLGLATDTQQQAYVLKLGEKDAPEGIKAALRTGNQLQDILAAEMVALRTGNDILARSLAEAKRLGINATIYTHPLGYHGHAAGPYIGLADQQQGVPGLGDYPLYDDTCHSMELNVKLNVPEWNHQELRMGLEQDIVFTGGSVHYLGGRQTQLHLIQ